MVIDVPAIDSDNLRLLMSRSGVTPKFLADELDVSLSYVARILNGQRRCKRNPVMRRRIADVLQVPQFMIECPDDESAVTP